MPYPHPVHYLPLTRYGHDVRMVYMDVAPSAAASGRTVVLLHGMNFYGEYWADAIDVLRKAGFRVGEPDQVGFGRSSKPIMPYTLSDMAMNTRALLESLGIERAAIVGHSMGGMVATRFALLYPDARATRALQPDRPHGREAAADADAARRGVQTAARRNLRSGLSRHRALFSERRGPGRISEIRAAAVPGGR